MTAPTLLSSPPRFFLYVVSYLDVKYLFAHFIKILLTHFGKIHRKIFDQGNDHSACLFFSIFFSLGETERIWSGLHLFYRCGNYVPDFFSFFFLHLLSVKCRLFTKSLVTCEIQFSGTESTVQSEPPSREHLPCSCSCAVTVSAVRWCKPPLGQYSSHFLYPRDSTLSGAPHPPPPRGS
jgi:hypothetical protein